MWAWDPGSSQWVPNRHVMKVWKGQGGKMTLHCSSIMMCEWHLARFQVRFKHQASKLLLTWLDCQPDYHAQLCRCWALSLDADLTPGAPLVGKIPLHDGLNLQIEPNLELWEVLKNQQCCISFSILTATAKACQQQVSGFKMYLMLQQQACCCLYPSCEEAFSKVLLRLRRSFIPVLTCMSRCMGYVKCVLCLRVPMSSCRVLKNPRLKSGIKNGLMTEPRNFNFLGFRV